MNALDLALRNYALMALSLWDFYGAMIECRVCPATRSGGLRMKARAIVGHDRVLTGRRV